MRPCDLTLTTKYLAHGLASVTMPAQLLYARVDMLNISDETRFDSRALLACLQNRQAPKGAMEASKAFNLHANHETLGVLKLKYYAFRRVYVEIRCDGPHAGFPRRAT